MTPPQPNLLSHDNHHIIENRNRKIIKLGIQKDKSIKNKASEK